MKKRDPLSWINNPKPKPFDGLKEERLFEQHEKGLEKRVGGKRTAGSGNKLDKGDVKTDKFRYEAKSTEKKSMSVKLAWLDKIVKEAIDSGRIPALSIHFASAENPTGKNWILIEEKYFREIFDESE